LELLSTGSIFEQSNPNDIYYVATYSARYISIAQRQLNKTTPNDVLTYEFFRRQ
jgi:hypothetical protein